MSGTIPVEAGRKNAAVVPRTAWRTTISQMRAVPMTRSTPSVASLTSATRLEAIIRSCRGTRSAQTPPASMNTTIGTSRAAMTKPRSEAEPVRSRTANAIATGTSQSPKTEIACAEKRSRNSRSRSASKDPGSLARTGRA